MTKKIALVALLPLMVAGWTLTQRSLVLVNVQEAGGHRIVVPVPLALAQGALIFAPDEARFLEAPEMDRYLPHAERVVDALRQAGDAVYVEVTDGDEHVRVSREDDVLRVRVREGSGTEVDAQLSFASARAVLRAYDRETGRFETSKLVSALQSMPRGEVVHVLDGSDQVSIRMW
jgi:hypothetical protein